MDGWMGGWMAGKAGLSIAYSNQKLSHISNEKRAPSRYALQKTNISAKITTMTKK
jgi:hypothetical protein